MKIRCIKCQLSRDPNQIDLGSSCCILCNKGRTCGLCLKFFHIDQLQNKNLHLVYPFYCQECVNNLALNSSQTVGSTRCELLDYIENTGKKVVPHGLIGNFSKKLEREHYVVVYSNPMIVAHRNDALRRFPGFYGAQFLGSLTDKYRVVRNMKIGPLSFHIQFHKKWNIPWDGNRLAAWREKTTWDRDEPYYHYDMVNGIVVFASKNIGLSKNFIRDYATRKEIVSAVREIVA